MLESLRDRLSLTPSDAHAMVERAFRDHPTHDFAVRLWNGEEVGWGDRRAFVISFADARTFYRCLASHDPAELAEAYVDGRVQVEGDLEAAVGLARYVRDVDVGARDRLWWSGVLHKSVPSAPHTPRADRIHVRAHYDLPGELFPLFLDERLVYSCAYFAEPTQRLERAQERKLDLVCRKLALRRGEMLLDLGCGWGALPIWAARHYGVRVLGITLSEHQLVVARERVRDASLADRVRIEPWHYAELPALSFDKISSVGMHEHVGVDTLGSYLSVVARALRPGGLFLDQGITQPAKASDHNGGRFVFRHVFPGAEIPDLARLQAEMEEADLEVLDVQAMRRHYALTMREWFRRFRVHREQAARLVSERTLRTWDIYLAGGADAFDSGVIGTHQVLAARNTRGGRSAYPLTRAYMSLDDEHLS